MPHTAETASVDLAKPLRLRLTGAVGFLLIGLMLDVGAASPNFAAGTPKQARLCKRHPTGQAYRHQLGPIRKTIPALDEAFQSVRPEQYRGVREQSWSETPMFTWRR